MTKNPPCQFADFEGSALCNDCETLAGCPFTTDEKEVEDMSNKQTYQLTQDNDGHWYVIPSNKQKEAAEYFRKVYKFWDETPEGEEVPEEPEWLEEIGGHPSLVKFEKYTIK